ncbi:E3 SUMO-protein ligase ZBED1-like isoform X2 [Temnothorax americanus]
MKRYHPEVEMRKSAVSLKRKTQISKIDNEDVIDIDDPDSFPTPSSLCPSTSSETRSVSVSPSLIVSKPSKQKQPRIEEVVQRQKSYQDGGSKAAEVTNKLLFMIAKDNLPFRTVEKEGFKIYTNALLPLYKIPSRKTITYLMEQKYDLLSSMMKTQLSQVQYLSLTTDIWTESLNMKSFLGLTAHFLVDEHHKSVTIGVVEMTERHQSEYLKNWLLSLIDKWNIHMESIVVVVSDNAANIKKAIVDAFGVDKHFACFAHTLNLVLAKIIDGDEIVRNFCAKIKKNCHIFKKISYRCRQITASFRFKVNSEC